MDRHNAENAKSSIYKNDVSLCAVRYNYTRVHPVICCKRNSALHGSANLPACDDGDAWLLVYVTVRSWYDNFSHYALVQTFAALLLQRRIAFCKRLLITFPCQASCVLRKCVPGVKGQRHSAWLGKDVLQRSETSRVHTAMCLPAVQTYMIFCSSYLKQAGRVV